MVSPGDALPYRAHEEDRPLNARAPRTDSQLFSCSEVAFQRRRRRPEQQSQSHTEKILRIPHFPLPRTRALSLTWQAAGTGVHPRVFLTNRKSSYYNILEVHTYSYLPVARNFAAAVQFWRTAK